MNPPVDDHTTSAEGRRVLEQCARRFASRLYRSAFRIVRDGGRAEDVVQDVFLDVMRRGRVLDDSQDPERVLHWQTLRTALSHVRGERARRRHEALASKPFDGTSADDPLDAAQRDEGVRAVQTACARLSDDLRVPLELRYREGLTFQRIAALLGCSEAAAHDRVQRALTQLRRQLPAAVVVVSVEGALACPEVLPTPTIGWEPLAAGSAIARTAGWTAFPAWWGLPTLIAAGVLLGVAWTKLVTPNEPSIPVVGIAAPTLVSRADGPPATVERSVVSAAALGMTPAPAPIPTQERTLRRTGRLVDGAGRGVEGARVRACTTPAGWKGPRSWGEATTDATGSFECEMTLPDGVARWFLIAEHPAFESFTSDAWLVQAVERRDVGRWTLTAIERSPPGDYELRVTVASEGLRVGGVTVRLFRQLDDERRAFEVAATTDAQGHATLEGAFVGDKWITVDGRSQGYRWLGQAHRLEAAGAHALELSLLPGVTLHGRVRHVDGSVPQHVTLRIQPGSLDARYDGATGEFTATGIDPGPITLTAWSAGCSSSRRSLIAAETGVEVLLKSADDPRDVGHHRAELHASLVDGDGRSVALDVREWVDVVAVEPASDWRGDVLPNRLFQAERQREQRMEATPRKVTEVHCVDLEPGTYRLRLAAPGFACTFTRAVTLAEGELVDLGTWTVDSEQRVDVRVVDSVGLPITNVPILVTGWGPTSEARLEAFRDGNAEQRRRLADLRSDVEGRAVLTRLPSDLVVRLIACGPSGALHEVRLDAGAERPSEVIFTVAE